MQRIPLKYSLLISFLPSIRNCCLHYSLMTRTMPMILDSNSTVRYIPHKPIQVDNHLWLIFHCSLNQLASWICPIPSTWSESKIFDSLITLGWAIKFLTHTLEYWTNYSVLYSLSLQWKEMKLRGFFAMMMSCLPQIPWSQNNAKRPATLPWPTAAICCAFMLQLQINHAAPTLDFDHPSLSLSLSLSGSSCALITPLSHCSVPEPQSPLAFLSSLFFLSTSHLYFSV